MFSRVEWVCGTHSVSSCCSPRCIDAACAAGAFARQVEVMRMLLRVGQDVCTGAETRRLRSYMFAVLWELLQEMNDEIPKA